MQNFKFSTLLEIVLIDFSKRLIPFSCKKHKKRIRKEAAKEKSEKKRIHKYKSCEINKTEKYTKITFR